MPGGCQGTALAGLNAGTWHCQSHFSLDNSCKLTSASIFLVRRDPSTHQYPVQLTAPSLRKVLATKLPDLMAQVQDIFETCATGSTKKVRLQET